MSYLQAKERVDTMEQATEFKVHLARLAGIIPREYTKEPEKDDIEPASVRFTHSIADQYIEGDVNSGMITRRLSVKLDYEKKQYIFRAGWPYHDGVWRQPNSGWDNNGIRIAWSKSDTNIKAELERRLLTEYNAKWPEVLESIKRDVIQTASRNATIKAVCDAVGDEYPKEFGHHKHIGRFGLYEIEVYATEEGPKVSFKTHSIPLAGVLDVIETLKRHMTRDNKPLPKAE